nr:RNA-directed DNA polymerase, eukaryota [Tanacetum cinerariifolium]
MEIWDPYICNDSYESELSDDEGDENDGSQSRNKVTADNDAERVSESSCIHNNDLLYDNNHNNIMPDKDEVLYEDPYDILNKRMDNGDDLKYPPRFTPNVINVKGVTSNEVNEHVNSISNKLEESISKEKLSSNNSVCSKRVHTDGSLLQLMDELVKETKMESMELVTSKTLWGNSFFYYVLSSSLGNSGGILCVWEPTLFVKDNGTSSDNFLAVMGTWVPSSSKLLIIYVYAQWDYILHLIDRWDGDYGYKTANKMSKLDRFLDSKGLLATFPYLSALFLDRNLSDHRPILMRELCIDYGPTPFRFFHSWFNLDGFDKMAIESDENTKFFHGILYSKRSQLAIRGTLVDGEWIIDPLVVKSMFLKYFSSQFSLPVSSRICFVGQFTNRLSLEQQADLEQNVSNKEIKSTIWDCGMNKSLGPDGFSFEFCHRYWKLLEHDIVAVVKEFFASVLFSDIPIDNSLTLSHIFFTNDAIFVDIYGEDGALNSLSSLSKRSPWLDIIRELIDDSILPKEDVATRWVKVMPIKINVFAWRVRLDKLSTRLNLSLKGIDVLTIVCPLCHAFVESDSHISFSCPMARHLWRNLCVGGSSRTLV